MNDSGAMVVRVNDVVKPVCINLVTPRDNGAVRKCQWCHGKLSKTNKNELIKRSSTQVAISVGIMCDDCYTWLLTMPETDFIGHRIHAEKIRAGLVETNYELKKRRGEYD